MVNNFMLLLPLIIVTAGAIALMLAATSDKLSVENATIGSMAVFGLAFLFQLMQTVPGDVLLYEQTFNGMLVVNGFSKAGALVILGCGFFTSMCGHTYFKKNPFITVEFYSLMLFAASGMLLLTMARELITVFISLEIMSLAIYILVGYNRRSLTAAEAVLKYLMLGAFAGGFFTMGSALIFGAVKSTKFAAIGSYIAAGTITGSPLILAGAFFILVALLFKAAAFPFHAWVVDVYDGAAVPVTGFMATALKTSIFVVFANFLVVDVGMQSGWITCLFWVSVLTMFIGNLVAIGQNTLKRMLAASGIVHTGYLLIALVAISTESFTGSVVGYYLAAYAAGTLGIFAALSYLGGEGEKRKDFDDFKGLAKVRPYSAAAIAIFLLSMAGIPPTAGFMGKLYIITSAIDAGQITLAVLGVVSSIISMWYYLRLIINMYFYEPEEEFADTEGTSLAQVCTMILVFCVFAISLYPVAI